MTHRCSPTGAGIVRKEPWREGGQWTDLMVKKESKTQSERLCKPTCQKWNVEEFDCHQRRKDLSAANWALIDVSFLSWQAMSVTFEELLLKEGRTDLPQVLFSLPLSDGLRISGVVW